MTAQVELCKIWTPLRDQEIVGWGSLPDPWASSKPECLASGRGRRGSVNAFYDRALAPHQDRNWALRLPPPLAKGGKGEVRILGCHHRRGKEGKGQCIRSSGQLAPGDEATLRLQRFGPNM